MANATRLFIKYKEQITPALHKQFSYSRIMQIPSLEKIVLSRGVGEAVNNKKLIDESVKKLGSIAGQQPVVTKAKKSISNFKLRGNAYWG